MSKFYDVIIAGGGPVGLFLACELSLARASVLVLERDPNVSSPWKKDPMGFRSLNTRSVENFYRRGLLSKLFDLDKRPATFQKKPGYQFSGAFAGIALNANSLELERYKYLINGPAVVPGPTTLENVETALLERAQSLDITILRGNGVTNIAAQDENSITVEAGEEETFQGRWLVGCDGGRSAIRKAAAIDFVGGLEPKFTGYVAHCDLENADILKPGFHPTGAGLYALRLPNTLYLLDYDNGAFDREKQEITPEHLEKVIGRIAGPSDLKVTKLHSASAFSERCKQATSYRKGRVLLAGDAAHIHPPLGGQGLNLGMGDAMNLGWKLGATVRAEKQKNGGQSTDLALLDTYDKERHPAGKWVLDWNRAQTAALEPGVYGDAVHSLLRDVAKTTDGQNLFIDRTWGLSQRYSLGDGESHPHPLVGSSAPDFEFTDGLRLGAKLESGKGLLVHLEGDFSLKDQLHGEYEERVDHLDLQVKDARGLRALLIRPDGIVAWVAEDNEQSNMVSLQSALRLWFGI